MNEYIIYKSYTVMLSADKLISADKTWRSEKYEIQMVSKIYNKCRITAS